jgi:hypothetical protein
MQWARGWEEGREAVDRGQLRLQAGADLQAGKPAWLIVVLQQGFDRPPPTCPATYHTLPARVLPRETHDLLAPSGLGLFVQPPCLDEIARS